MAAMDFTDENHAPTTETDSSSFSIPSKTPLISHSATPSSQPILPQYDVVVTDRLTLQPVPPSKRAIPKSCHEATENVNVANEFLPRKLAQIIEE
ncbi:Bgt-20130 [Blumeria graminis f. sp. tritici]|uniref:Bgt-20130 n=2 Tax=Blumeria graminis f. sp. tritici TaxID=62690 RepID=A0A9X9MEK5_BLUGR|nr:Bgt-20130 [Blumeria graminis f. sp. tritici]